MIFFVVENTSVRFILRCLLVKGNKAKRNDISRTVYYTTQRSLKKTKTRVSFEISLPITDGENKFRTDNVCLTR